MSSSTHYLQALSRFAVAAAGVHRVDEVLWLLTDEIVAELGFEDCVVYLADEKRETLRQVAAFGQKSPSPHVISNPIELRFGQGITGRAAAIAKSILVNDVREDPNYVVDDQARLSELAVPIVVEGQVVGVIDSEHSELNFYTQDHQFTLEALASVIGAKYEQAKLVTQLRRSEAEALYAASHDPLTGLPNRAQFLKWLDAKLNLAKGSSVLVLLDLDRFKVVNDRFGHTVGDELLVAVAERLKRAIPTNAKLARLSGDEFTCLIEGNVTEAKAITQSMLDSLKQPIELKADLVNIRASAGLAQMDPTMGDSSSWLRRADAMLYQQKGVGESGLMVYGEHLRTNLGFQSELEVEIETAIAQKQFRFALQPIVSLEDGCTIGAEALVRWIHPKHGFIPPNDFISSAERSGHVKGIDGCVVDLVRDWFEHNDSESYISVNLSPASLSVLNDDTTLHCLSEEFGPRLRVEVTERAMIANFELAAAGLEHLRSHGVKVLLDDFCTGYSSLSYVHRLPVDALKIDQSFVARLGEDTRSESLIRMIIALADSLSLDVIAEGIETEHQRALLKSLNVEFGQGYLFGKPVLQA